MITDRNKDNDTDAGENLPSDGNTVEKSIPSTQPPPVFKVPLGPARPTAGEQRKASAAAAKPKLPAPVHKASKPLPPCSYVEPEWASVADAKYSFDVLKGSILCLVIA